MPPSGSVLVSSSLWRRLKATCGLTPQPRGPRQWQHDPVPALFIFLACATAVCSDPVGSQSICLKPQMSAWRNDCWVIGSCSAICLSVGDVLPQTGAVVADSKLYPGAWFAVRPGTSGCQILQPHSVCLFGHSPWKPSPQVTQSLSKSESLGLHHKRVLCV